MNIIIKIINNKIKINNENYIKMWVFHKSFSMIIIIQIKMN